MPDMREQLRSDMVAIISLVIALHTLGSLQQIIFYAHYAKGDKRGDPRMGWADMLTINDLAALMPAEIARDASDLRAIWESDSAGLAEDDAAFQRIDVAIDALRKETLASLRTLD